MCVKRFLCPQYFKFLKTAISRVSRCCMMLPIRFIPTTYVVRGKLMFSQESVIVFRGRWHPPSPSLPIFPDQVGSVSSQPRGQVCKGLGSLLPSSGRYGTFLLLPQEGPEEGLVRKKALPTNQNGQAEGGPTILPRACLELSEGNWKNRGGVREPHM